MNIPVNLHWTDCFSLHSWLSAQGFIGKICISCSRLSCFTRRHRLNTCSLQDVSRFRLRRSETAALSPGTGGAVSPRLDASKSDGKLVQLDKQMRGTNMRQALCREGWCFSSSVQCHSSVSLCFYWPCSLFSLLHQTQQERHINQPDYYSMKQAVSVAAPVYAHLFSLSGHKCDPLWRVAPLRVKATRS